MKVGNLLFERVLFSQLIPGTKYYIEYKHCKKIYPYIDFFVEFDGFQAVFDDIYCCCYEDWRYYMLIPRKKMIQTMMERRAFKQIMERFGLDVEYL